MQIPGMPVRSRGYFSFKVVEGDVVTKESAMPTPNLLLDSFFTMLANNSQAINNAVIRVGTGSAPRNVTMGSLTSQATLVSGTWPAAVATHGNLAFDAAQGNYVGYSTYVSTFGVGQLVGNFSEWGIEFNNDTTASRTTTHASSLIKDGQGNPTTLQLTATERLIVTYVLETRILAQDFTSATVVKLDGVDQPITVIGRWGSLSRPVNEYYGTSANTLTARTGPIGPVNSALGGTSLSTKSSTIVLGGTNRIIRTSLLSSEWNFANGIEFIEYSASLVKYSFTPGLPKAVGRTATIDLAINFGRL